MTQRSVVLTDELDAFIASRIDSGEYADANEVMQEALRTLERQEREYQGKVVALREALDEGEASGAFSGDAFASVREELGIAQRHPR